MAFITNLSLGVKHAGVEDREEIVDAEIGPSLLIYSVLIIT